MPKQDLDLEVIRHGRPMTEFSAHCDPFDSASLSQMLRDWLAGDHWAPGLWPEFELLVRLHGEYRVRSRVRV
jgi:hypothetical protein